VESLGVVDKLLELQVGNQLASRLVLFGEEVVGDFECAGHPLVLGSGDGSERQF
jgi:hypothetical protein